MSETPSTTFIGTQGTWNARTSHWSEAGWATSPYNEVLFINNSAAVKVLRDAARIAATPQIPFELRARRSLEETAGDLI